MSEKPNPWPAETTIADYLEKVYGPIKLAMRTKKTWHQYQIVIRLYGEYLGHPATLGDLQDDTFTAFLGWGKVKRSWAPATMNKARNHVLALWRFAARKRHTDEWPDVPRAQEMKRIPQSWNESEMQRILTAAATTIGTVSDFPARLWWPALLMFLYDTGSRIGAALAVRWGDVDLVARTIILRAENQKQHADQVLYIHVNTVRAMEAIRPENLDPSKLVFPWDRVDNHIFFVYRSILNRAGFQATSRDLFHKLRRTAATETAKLGGTAAASDLLGHSSEHVTKVYVDRTKLDRNTFVDDVPRPETETIYESRPLPPAGTLAIADSFVDFVEILKNAGYDKDYVSDVASTLKAFADAMGLKGLSDIKPTTLNDYAAMLLAKGFALNTIKRHRGAVVSFLRWLVNAKGYLGDIAVCYASSHEQVQNTKLTKHLQTLRRDVETVEDDPIQTAVEIVARLKSAERRILEAAVDWNAIDIGTVYRFLFPTSEPPFLDSERAAVAQSLCVLTSLEFVTRTNDTIYPTDLSRKSMTRIRDAASLNIHRPDDGGNGKAGAS